jgi:hypothetical protein
VTPEPTLTPKELKSRLSAEGFLVYRTLQNGVRIGERPRENLILDSGVSVFIGSIGLTLTTEVRAEGSGAPELGDEAHYERARARALGLLSDGFTVVGSHATQVVDPGNAQRVLDVWYEVTCEKRELSLTDIAECLRSVLAYPRR